MSASRYVLGLDFGTESARAVVVDVTNGAQLASAVYQYVDGVIDEALPDTNASLEPDWALQNPADYIGALKHAVPEAVKHAGVRGDDIIGIGVDFTACTLVPTLLDGTPLSETERWRSHRHGWAKLWKHHAAQPEADHITSVALGCGESWLREYGGKISSEWLHSKALQVLNEAPEVYAATEKFVEAGDWLVWQMTGAITRNACAAGYKGLWGKERGYPTAEFLHAVHPGFADLNQKLSGPVQAPGSYAGALTEEAAAWMGLAAGTAVAVGTIDAHAAVPGAGVTEPGRMVIIMGTSSCHMIVDRAKHIVPGTSGVVEDGILPGLYGYEAGQAGVGDIFQWFVEHSVPPEYHQRATEQNTDVYAILQKEASRIRPGETGLLALDWWNGCRSVLVDAGLSGMIVGATLGTRAPDIYRALIEGTAFGTAMIIETFEQHGVAVQEIVACGGLAERNELLLQIYADVTGREIRVAGTGLASALGAAMLGAVAAGAEAGGYHSLTDAAEAMATYRTAVYKPNAGNHVIYNQLYAEYRKLHDYFGRGENNVMKRLRAIR